MRHGLSAKLWWIVFIALLAGVVLGFIGWRQQAAGLDHLARLSGEAIHEASIGSEQRRALAMAQLIADAVVNPLYYFDLVTIGEISRSALDQPDVAYVLIHDGDGLIVHDGSHDITRFGQRMGDSLAVGAINARGPVLQSGDGVIDAAVPVWLGKERIGGVRVGISMLAPAVFERDAAAVVQAQGQQLRRQMFETGMIFLGLLLALVAFTAWAVSRGLVRPVQHLARAARRIEQGNLSDGFSASGRGDEIGELEIAFVRMRESLEQHDREMRRIAFDDSLTGLANRAAFRTILEHRIGEAQARGWPLALLFIDLDEFKRINDSLGHDAGDEVLLELAERMRRAIATLTHDEVDLARLGGDEFVALVRGGEARERAVFLAKALLAELAESVTVRGRAHVVGASIGVSLFPQDGTDPATLLKNADIAMYRAKLDGKNCFRFHDPSMEAAMESRIRTEHELRLALQHDELVVYYQPIQATSGRRIIGVEALVRWNHPQRGLVGPDEFIPVAEQSGLIEELGRFVLRTACVDAMRWLDGEAGLFVSVNVSAVQLQRGGLPETVQDALQRSGLPAGRLHLELTETTVLSNEAEAIAVSRRLREQGTRIWLDDFGTGFSGLSHLRRIPVDGVKIDRSFVADMLDDPDDLALTAAIIAMAHSLGVVVTAEGVESEGQYEALRLRGCDNQQGFLFGRAMSSAQLDAVLRAAG